MKTLLTTIALVLTVFTFNSEAQAANCTVDLVNGRGMTVDTFRGYGYDRIDACQDARRDCRRAIRAGYYRARILTCEVRQPRRDRLVRRTCTARLTGPRGMRTIQTFLGQASGVRGTGVKRQACQRAERQCRRYKERTGRYRAICEIDRLGRDVIRPIGPVRRVRRL